MSGESIVIMAYAGHRGDESPRAFVLGGRLIEVRNIIEQWIEEDAVSRKRFRCFRVEGSDQVNHLLRFDEADGAWFYAGGKTDG